MAMDSEYVNLFGVKDQQYYDLIAAYLSEEWKATGAASIKDKNEEKALRCFQVAHILDPSDKDAHLSLLQTYSG